MHIFLNGGLLSDIIPGYVTDPFAFITLPPFPLVWYRPFAFVTLNIALNNIQHATHRPSIRAQHPKERPIKRYESKMGTITIPTINA